MAELSSFIPVETVTIVYCRASRIWSSSVRCWLNWREVTYDDLFSFPASYSVQDFAQDWDRDRGKQSTSQSYLTFAQFRERVQQVSAEFLTRIEGIVVVHDYQTLQNLVRVLPSCIVVPMDDDDFLSPKIGSVLPEVVHASSETQLVVWPDLSWWCEKKGSEIQEIFRVQNLDSGTVSTVGSNSYAITKQAFCVWTEKQIHQSLQQHWKCRIPLGDKVQVIKDCLSLEAKHIGSTSHLLRQVGKDYWWSEDQQDFLAPTWAESAINRVRELQSLTPNNINNESLCSQTRSST